MFGVAVKAKKRKSKLKLDEKGKSAQAIPSAESIEAARKYRLKCGDRYKEDCKRYYNSFYKTVEEIEHLQPNALAGVRVSRVFTFGVVNKYCKIKDPLTPNQRRRVEKLLAEKVY